MLFSKNFKTFALVVLGFISLISCTITRSNLVGKWLVPANDTVAFSDNGSFQMIRTNPKLSKVQPRNAKLTRDTVYGIWTIQSKSVVLKFKDSSVSLGGDCISLRYSWRIGKSKLIKPLYCNKPTHHSILIKKI